MKITSNAPSTPIITPARNPPPMSRLTIAAGNTRNADNTRKPRKYRANAPIIIRLRIMPSMKLKYPMGTTHGNTLTQAAKKTGDSNAAALMAISTAATKNNTTGIHQYFTRKGGRGNGPNSTPPGGIIRGPACMQGLQWIGEAIGVGIGRGTLVL